MAYDRFIAICNPLRYSSILTNTKDVIKLACANITFNRLYPVVVVFAMVLLDFLIIFFSYTLILKTVMSITSGERAKALNTCVSHICCILVFYVTVVGLTFIHRFGRHAPHVVHITMSYVYFLFPPFMNPVIYSIKTKQIQSGIIRFFSLPHSRA
ncbi:Olfactory receptor 51B6 [Camelus dromedarius]|uniref:Olfactory receptor 51B6 n=1 Tax=Camelus dromedarius TaxID=9838 RepID=A0A5N4DLE8_CAMDR|nr:Olfactory receptor 51B6 [Camelus dromedarius]